jgi:hypothetical protein
LQEGRSNGGRGLICVGDIMVRHWSKPCLRGIIFNRRIFMKSIMENTFYVEKGEIFV